MGEKDVSDKAAWIQALPRPDVDTELGRLTRVHEALRAVDDATAEILDALGSRVDNTIIVYLSDNGLMLGVHRLDGKNVPYRLASEVPMFIRWDGHIAAGSTARVTPQIDLTATIADALGLDWPMEGKPISQPRFGTLLEQTADGHPAYCGYRTARYMFVKYAGDARELYDYKHDPDELTSVAGEARYASVLSNLQARAEAACAPVPPLFHW